MQASVTRFFERYEELFRQALRGQVDMEEVAALYASEFVMASPAGVMTGKNDEQLKRIMSQGYERYRKIGTRDMRIRSIRTSPIDEQHCVAHVAWTATYAREDRPDLTIDFDVHYLVQKLGEKPEVFGWVSGDEQALLKEQGVI